MKIEDLEPSYEASYCMCLEEWSDEMREAGDKKRRWLEEAKGKGLHERLDPFIALRTIPQWGCDGSGAYSRSTAKRPGKARLYLGTRG